MILEALAGQNCEARAWRRESGLELLADDIKEVFNMMMAGEITRLEELHEVEFASTSGLENHLTNFKHSMAAVKRPPDIAMDTWLALPEELQRELAGSGSAGQSSTTTTSRPAPAPSRPEPIPLDDSDDDDLIVVSEKITTKASAASGSPMRPPRPAATDDESYARQLQASEYAAMNKGSGPSLPAAGRSGNDDVGERVLFDDFEPPEASGPVDLRWFTTMNEQLSGAKARALSKKSSETKKGQSIKGKGKRPAKDSDSDSSVSETKKGQSRRSKGKKPAENSDTDSSVTGDERPKKRNKRKRPVKAPTSDTDDSVTGGEQSSDSETGDDTGDEQGSWFSTKLDANSVVIPKDAPVVGDNRTLGDYEPVDVESAPSGKISSFFSKPSSAGPSSAPALLFRDPDFPPDVRAIDGREQAPNAKTITGQTLSGESISEVVAADSRGGVYCACGHAKLLTVHKSNENHGRMFWACAKPRGEQCDFFRWAVGNAEAPHAKRDMNYEWRRLGVAQGFTLVHGAFDADDVLQGAIGVRC